MDALKIISHIQVHAISDLVGDEIEGGHYTLKFFHLYVENL
jgi:hypothetical protein